MLVSETAKARISRRRVSLSRVRLLPTNQRQIKGEHFDHATSRDPACTSRGVLADAGAVRLLREVPYLRHGADSLQGCTSIAQCWLRESITKTSEPLRMSCLLNNVSRRISELGQMLTNMISFGGGHRP